jgi:hypothetical protein
MPNVRMTDKLKRIWKEVVIAFLDALFWNLCGRTEENHGKPHFSLRIAVFLAEILTDHPQIHDWRPVEQLLQFLNLSSKEQDPE